MRRILTVDAACAAAAAVLAATAAPAEAGSSHALYANGSDVATPLGPVALRAAPGSSRVLARVRLRTIFGSPTRLAAVGQSGDWLAVISASLDNRVRGFVHRSRVRLAHDPFSLEVDRSARRLTVWRMGVRVRRIGVAVGAASSPTPLGRFSITDKLSHFWPSVYGCCVLALSGRQTHVPRGWNGGNRLAIHAGDGIGGAVSAGCLRASSKDMAYLMERLPLGTQVVVHP